MCAFNDKHCNFGKNYVRQFISQNLSNKTEDISDSTVQQMICKANVLVSLSNKLTEDKHRGFFLVMHRNHQYFLSKLVSILKCKSMVIFQILRDIFF